MTAVNAHHRQSVFSVHENGIHGTRGSTLPAFDAQILFKHDPAAFALYQCSRGADRGTGSRGAGQTDLSGKSRAQSSGGMDSDPRPFPGHGFVHQSGTGQGTGITADASFHAQCP